MSLDVYLIVNGFEFHEKILIRECGKIREVSKEEWDEIYPGREPAYADSLDGEVYWANITHNLNRMATHAGKLYEAMWRPEELGATTAAQIIEPLEDGLAILKGDRERFEQFNPANGWGNYDNLVSFTEEYLKACREYPYATIRVSR